MKKALPAIAVGVLISLLVILIGKGPVNNYLMSANIAGFVRRMISEDNVISDKNMKKISHSIYQSMMENPAMVRDLVSQVSDCIDSAILNAADSVEKAMIF